MEKPTKILSEEHKHILKVVEALFAECIELDAGNELDQGFFEKAIDFIRNYADGFHHAKEEDILFVELQKDSVQMHCNPIHQMLHEHDLGRNYVKGLQEGLDNGDINKITENARGYAHLLQQHIFKEDNILFPMADNALNQEAQDAVSQKFKEVEQKKYTVDDIQKYVSIVQEFENRIANAKTT